VSTRALERWWVSFRLALNQHLDKLLIGETHLQKKAGRIVSPLKNDSLQLADRNTELADVILSLEPEWIEACVKGAFDDLVVQQGNLNFCMVVVEPHDFEHLDVVERNVLAILKDEFPRILPMLKTIGEYRGDSAVLRSDDHG